MSNIKKPTKVRCFVCRKKLNIIKRFDCKCKKIFCMTHLPPFKHNCLVRNVTKENQLLIERNNICIEADKIINRI